MLTHQRPAPQSIDLAAAVITQAHALAAADDVRALLHVGGDRRDRMEQAVPVHILERIVGAVVLNRIAHHVAPCMASTVITVLCLGTSFVNSQGRSLRPSMRVLPCNRRAD